MKANLTKQQNKNENKMINSREGLSVYGYIRQNFDRKCHIQGIIATIIQFYMNKGGLLYVCGKGDYGRLGIGESYDKYYKEPTRVQSVKEIVDIAAYDYHTMLVDYNGRVWAVGHGDHGRLGTGNTENVKVPKPIFLKQRAIAVGVGSQHSLILIDNGNVLSCGANARGQLGHGDFESQSVPKVIEALKGHRIIQISAGYFHNGALSEKGNLFMWGYNYSGQCGVVYDKGDHIKTPIIIKLEERVSVIECGSFHSLLISMNNLLYSFGSGGSYKLGHGTEEKKYVPTLIESLKEVSMINVAGGYLHTLCVDDEFNVWAFGSNAQGQCGHSNNIEFQTTPKKVEYFAANAIKAKEVAAGSSSSCVITQHNECFVFGKNNDYQIGLKEKKGYFVPTKFPLPVQKASMGAHYAAFIHFSS